MQREDGETAFEAVSWTMETLWTEDLETRIRTGLQAWLTAAQAEAREIAAETVRAARNELLTESDALMALDRLGLTVPTGTSFTAWLSFLRGIGDMLSGTAAKYRQALRDIPNQPGFPYDVNWPEKP